MDSLLISLLRFMDYLTGSRLYPYGIAVFSVGLALVLMLALDPVAAMTQTPFLLFFGAVTLSAWQGGMRGGGVAIALSALVSNYFFFDPLFSLTLTLSNSIRLGVFVLECLLVSALCSALRTTNQQLKHNLSDLKASEERYRYMAETVEESRQQIIEILESITDGFYTLDHNWCFAFVNRRVEQILKRSRHELLGHSIWELFPDLDQTPLGQCYQQAVAEQRPIVLERSGFVNPDRWFEFHINPLKHGLAVYFQDVTERKRSEVAVQTLNRDLERRVSELQTLLEVVPVGIAIAQDPQCQVIKANPFFQRIFNISPDVNLSVTGADTERVQCQRLRNGQEIAVDELPLQVAAQQGIDVRNTEIQILRSDGAAFDLLGSATPLLDEQGAVRGSVAVFMDISERKQIEAERESLLEREKAARQAAESANQIKDEFLAVLSHELRSPLNPILGWSKLLQTRKLSDEMTQRALSTIERNANLQTQLIEDLLDVSRILRGKMALTMMPVNLATTIEAALDTIRLSAEAKNIELIWSATTIGTVWGDTTRLQQVVWNLLSNAIKFTPDGGRVTIRLERVDDEGTDATAPAALHLRPAAQITITDTGKGIKPDFLSYVFDYFRQEDGTTTRQFGGLGLGLAIVRHITELHQGRVYADSPGEGLGATFIVRLPLLLHSVTDSSVSIAAAASTAAPQPLQGVRVLVVDNETDILDLMGFVAEQAGAIVLQAASAQDALMQLQHTWPDVLVCDIGMPDMDGYMLIQQVRQLPDTAGGTIPAIALTAYAGESDQQQAIAAGFQRHIAKPATPDALIEAIIAVL